MHQKLDSVSPSHLEVDLVSKNGRASGMGINKLRLRDSARSIPAVLLSEAEVHQYLLILGRNDHGEVGVYGVLFEMMGERPENQLVKDVALIDRHIVVDFVVCPVGEAFRGIINSIETVPAHQRDRVRKNSPRNSKIRAETTSRDH